MNRYLCFIASVFFSLTQGAYAIGNESGVVAPVHGGSLSPTLPVYKPNAPLFEDSYAGLYMIENHMETIATGDPGDKVTSCATYKFSAPVEGLVHVPIAQTRSIPAVGASCGGAYCGKNPGLIVFQTMGDGLWERIGSDWSDYPDNKFMTHVYSSKGTFTTLAICRGSGGPGRDDLLVGSVFVQAIGAFDVWMSPDGTDTNAGDRDHPVLTLAQAQKIIYAKNPSGIVTVHIKPGTYYGQNTIWNFVNGSPIHFNKSGWNLPGKPVFDGCLANDCSKSSIKRLLTLKLNADSAKEKASYLIMQNLVVANYVNAIGFMSSETAPKPTHNTIDHCIFRDIGNGIHDQDEVGYAVIDIVRSTNNSITDNSFHNIINSDGENAVLLHVLYIADDSTNNYIAGNIIDKTSGIPIKFRNNSGNNTIVNNRFTNIGYTDIDGKRISAISDWYCTVNCKPECPSWDNYIGSNFVGGSNPLCIAFVRGNKYDCSDPGLLNMKIYPDYCVRPSSNSKRFIIN